MTNHNPTITSSAATGSFSEYSNTTDSTALHLLSGTMNFKDSDSHDTHTTSASLKSAVLSSGSVIPADTLADLNAAMSSTILVDSNSSGKLKWSFGAADEDFDFLAKNQTLTLTYDIVLYDNHGGMTKKTVTITVTGTDDKPVIDFGVNAVVTEQAGQTLSLSPDVAHIAVHFEDPDLTNTGHTASVTGVSASGATDGLLPGILGELELMSFFHIDNVVKTSGSSDGTINTTFAAPDLAFDYLAEGETVDIVYTIKVNDNAGMTSTQTVTVTVVGTNDGPKYLSGPDTEHLVEGEDLSPAGDLTACGDFLFADIDLSDQHTVAASVTASRSGGGAVPLTEAQLLAALTTEVDPDSTNHLLGEVDWRFALDNTDVAFLNSGETLTLTYTVTITDDAGGTDTQTITVTILGTNDPVVVTSGPGAASLAEFADVTGSPVLNPTPPATGTITFSDTDLGDTHSVNVTVAATTWPGGSVPGPTETDLAAALLTTLHDSTGIGSGSIDWSFSIPDFDLDFLGAGETLEVVYNVAVSDGPTSASQTVTITIDGANDLPLITSGPGSGSATEADGVTGDPTPTTPATGTLSFTDVDLNDTHFIAVAVASAIWSGHPDFVVPSPLNEDLMTALSTVLNDSSGTGSGSIDWTFSIPDADLDFLAAGETLTVTYDVTVFDSFAGSTQTVTITLNGAADDILVNPLTASIFDTAAIDTGSLVAVGNLIADAGDINGDFSTILSVTDVEGHAIAPGGFTTVAGAYGTLFVFSDGFYQYVANSALDPLPAGASATEVFDVTVSGSNGDSETTTLTFDVSGADDAAVITAAIASGTITEDLGPPLLVNGGFESGDLSGWTTSSASIQALFFGAGGQFGDYVVGLGPTGPSQSLSQHVSTTFGEHYTVSFYVGGDPEAGSNALTVTWGGTTLLTLTNVFGGLTQYTFDVVGDGDPMALTFSYHTDGAGMFLDQINVASDTGPATATVDGSISFADVEITDTHTASFTPLDSGYFGTFTLDSVVEGGGTGSVAWHFSVDNADLQFLQGGETLSQVYTVAITGINGAVTFQDVTVTLAGIDDAHVSMNKTASVPGGTADIAGEVISYEIAATNDGTEALTNPVVSDPSVSDLAAVMSGGFNVGDFNVNNVFDIGETWQYTASYTVTQNDLDTNGGGDGLIENTASVTTAEGVSATASASITVGAALVMDKSDAVGTTWVDSNENGQADAGIDLIVFAFSLTNNANVTLSDIVINDPLLGGILSGSGVPTELDAGETTTFAINYFLTQDDVDAHHVFNSATASAHDPSNNFVNALAQFDVLLP